MHVKKVSGGGSTITREWAEDVRCADGSVVRAEIDEPRSVSNRLNQVESSVRTR
ncbi:MAG: hypothetical protein QM658_14675 [Gordonia sp. (in: high G+C Gram-positive bacteria)]